MTFYCGFCRIMTDNIEEHELTQEHKHEESIRWFCSCCNVCIRKEGMKVHKLSGKHCKNEIEKLRKEMIDGYNSLKKELKKVKKVPIKKHIISRDLVCNDDLLVIEILGDLN